jgi:hypothetical protein
MSMNAIAAAMMERISSGLRRKTLTSCSKWAESCRVMGQPFPGPWTFYWHPWLREMHDSEAEFNVGQKAAQVGYTETVLNRTFYMMDIKHVSCLYVLPSSTPDASDFSSGRFNPAIELSPHLSKIFSTTDNVGHKRAGPANLYIRGSRSRGQLKSIPTGFIVLDEVDEMDQANIPLAFERASGQKEKQIWALSTPTTPKTGINMLFRDSTQEHFFFECPSCSQWTELTFPECLEITAEDVMDPNIKNSFYKCKECQSKLDHDTKPDWLANGKWVPTQIEASKRGFYINQMYSSAVSGRPHELALSFLKSQRDRSEEQEFYNSKLGLEHIVDGAGVTDTMIDQCIGDYRSLWNFMGKGLLTIGIDVGKWLHYEIDEWFLSDYIDSADLNMQAVPKVVAAGKCREFAELDDIMMRFRPNAGVIDIHPERRMAFNFANRFYGIIKMCMYIQGVAGKNIQTSPEEEHVIKVDRTSWLDLSLGRFRTKGQIILPFDISQEYRSHIKTPVRVYEKDQFGNPVGRYRVEENAEDHFAHARNYAEMALPFALSRGNPVDIPG